MLARLCLLETRSSLPEVALNRFSFQTSKRCEISFFLSPTTIGEELRTSETSQDVYNIGFYVLLVHKLNNMGTDRHVVRVKQPKLSLGARGPRGAREGMEGGPVKREEEKKGGEKGIRKKEKGEGKKK